MQLTPTIAIRATGAQGIVTVDLQSDVQLRLTVHEATSLIEMVKRAKVDALMEARPASGAEIFAFPTKRVRALARRESRIRDILRASEAMTLPAPPPFAHRKTGEA